MMDSGLGVYMRATVSITPFSDGGSVSETFFARSISAT